MPSSSPPDIWRDVSVLWRAAEVKDQRPKISTHIALLILYDGALALARLLRLLRRFLFAFLNVPSPEPIAKLTETEQMSQASQSQSQSQSHPCANRANPSLPSSIRCVIASFSISFHPIKRSSIGLLFTTKSSTWSSPSLPEDIATQPGTKIVFNVPTMSQNVSIKWKATSKFDNLRIGPCEGGMLLPGVWALLILFSDAFVYSKELRFDP
ncbi:hypothetical protein PRIPAC_71815 [Pristionchus pacificus]|uniref:Uncharacterized protein n=1 Tax=Pristionchus pacificus TaxID=54126 RepID=A0A2A6CF11_PRIPA|nr:hypothetical protein PRIPAC_71815 [Pristionchus pacificus]|eukprot:PDM76719.1 hypothetical protein PRIPAC_42114 [Pristionchus pacificus]